ncbi:ATP-binding protein [Paraflavisolibacter sp. H34]|uniref:ATP-binding protein n=1 Tax=Huijunlia imazamoxiresistens TaxID=3127457 RepID=UPI00301B254A
MNAKHTSIQQKLMRVILLTSGAVLLMTCAAFFIYERITYRDITRQQLSTLSEIVAANSTAALAFDDKESATEILDALATEEHIVAAGLYDKEDGLFAQYGAQPSGLPARPGPDGYRFSDRHLDGYQGVYLNGIRIGTLYIRSDMKAMHGRFRLYGLITVLFMGVSFLVAYLLSKRLQKSISIPILELAQKARVVSQQHDYSVRALKHSEDEVGALTEAFNHMLARIEAQNADITAFAHQLERKVALRTKELEETNTTLRQQNDFVESILNASVDLIAVFDRDYRYLKVNQQATRFYHLKRESLTGKKLLEVFPQLAGSAMVEDLEKAFGGQVVHRPAYHSYLANRQFENFFIPLRNSNGEVDRVLVIGHDISSIMEASEKLKAVNMALERSNQDLEQFAYVASHDLQEPLRKIQVFSDLCEKNAQKPEVLNRYLGKINSSARRMTELIKAVLNYSRLSKESAEFVAVDINQVIESLRADLELTIEEKAAVITTNKLPLVMGNALQLNQLFLNLLTNALKFCERQPRISIHASRATAAELGDHPSLDKDRHYVKIVFADNGIGFNQQYADKIFTIFQRLHNRDNYSGTGIGLALCKKIVEKHGGSIAVSSRVGAGTTFFIFLPLHTAYPGPSALLPQAVSYPKA